MSSLYELVWEMGALSGCHQRADRSFHVCGKQFPVCARCTGAALGYITGGMLYIPAKLPVIISVLFCAIMFFDWLLQHLQLLESTNMRRLITGLLCGYGLMQLYISAIVCLVDCLRVLW